MHYCKLFWIVIIVLISQYPATLAFKGYTVQEVLAIEPSEVREGYVSVTRRVFNLYCDGTQTDGSVLSSLRQIPDDVTLEVGMYIKSSLSPSDLTILTREGFSYQSLGGGIYALSTNGGCEMSRVIVWDGTFVDGNRQTIGNATVNINGNELVTNAEGMLDYSGIPPIQDGVPDYLIPNEGPYISFPDFDFEFYLRSSYLIPDLYDSVIELRWDIGVPVSETRFSFDGVERFTNLFGALDAGSPQFSTDIPSERIKDTVYLFDEKIAVPLEEGGYAFPESYNAVEIEPLDLEQGKIDGSITLNIPIQVLWADGSPAVNTRILVNGIEKTTDDSGYMSASDVPSFRSDDEIDSILLGDKGSIRIKPIDLDLVFNRTGGRFYTGIKHSEVYLDFGEVPLLWDPTCERRLFFGPIYLDDDDFKAGSMPGAELGSDYQQQLRNAVQATFWEAGANVEIILGEPEAPSESTVVYFPLEKPECLLEASADIPIVNGRADDIDKYNQRPEGQAIVFIEPNSSVEFGAQVTAHEIGHMFGLFHIERLNNEGERDIFDPINFDSIMDSDLCRLTGCPDRFHNGVVSRQGEEGGNHNPTYHLRRWGNGESDLDLKTQLIFPGTYDTTSGETFDRFLKLVTFSSETSSLDSQRNQTISTSEHILYDFTILQKNGFYGYNIVEQLEIVELEELSQFGFNLPLSSQLLIYASTTPDGAPDLIMSRGTPNASSVLLGVDSIDEIQPVQLFEVDDSGAVIDTIAQFLPLVDTVNVPSISITVDAVENNVFVYFPVKAGLNYQMQKLNGEGVWENTGDPFIPTKDSYDYEWIDSTVVSDQDLDAIKALYRVVAQTNKLDSNATGQ